MLTAATEAAVTSFIAKRTTTQPDINGNTGDQTERYRYREDTGGE